MEQEKLRIRFRKEGPLRFVGHNDLLRSWQRLLRRSGLPIRFTEGYDPRPRMSSPLSLALGVEGTDEILEVALARPVPLDTARDRLAAEAFEGLSIVGVTCHPVRQRSEVVAVEYTAPLPAEVSADQVRERAGPILAASSLPLRRRSPGKPDRTVDVRPMIEWIRVEAGEVRFRLALGSHVLPRVQEILELLGLGNFVNQGMVPRRSAVVLREEAHAGDRVSDPGDKGNVA